MSIGAEVDLNKEFGCQDMTGNIKRVLIKDPQSAYKNQENIDSQYEDLNYFGKPKFEQALKDYSLFRSILENNQIEIHTLPEDSTTTLDSIYTHDACLVSNSGVILCSMGKELRKKEPEMISNYFESIGIPIGIPDICNFEGHQPLPDSHGNTWESIGIPMGILGNP